MKEMMRFGLTLAVICIIAAGLLSGVNLLTKSKIIAQAQAEEETSLKEVFPNADFFEPVKSAEQILYYKAYDKKGGMLLGAAFKASAKGYSSVIDTMAAMLKDGTILKIKVLSQNETPGLGSQVAEGKFTSQFSNRKDLNTLSAITGATISSKAVINSVKEKADQIRELIKNER